MPGVLGTICCDSQSSLAFLRIRQRVVLICELINYLGLKLVYVQMTRKTPILFRGTVTLVSLTLRLLPVVLLMAAAGGWFGHVEDGPWLLRNLLPLLLVVVLSLVTLYRGAGRWTGRGWREPLALVGFAIPTVGLAIYLHYAYAVNLDGMFAGGAGDLFRYLPVYTAGAGLIGYAIGWIVGRNVN